MTYKTMEKVAILWVQTNTTNVKAYDLTMIDILIGG